MIQHIKSHLFLQFKSKTVLLDPLIGLSGAITPCQGGPWSNGNEEVLHIPQKSRAEVLPSDCLVSYQDTR